MAEDLNVGERRVQMIANSGLSIYDGIPPGKAELWIPLPELEYLLNSRLVGIPLSGLPLRTRSKVVKEHVCRALGYPVPATFRKTQPRFPGQHLDVYVQKSTNLQVWNEELEAARRYAIVRVAEDDTIVVVKVVTGGDLAELDATGTLTQKYQARVIRSAEYAELVTDDTDRLSPLVTKSPIAVDLSSRQPTASPRTAEPKPEHSTWPSTMNRVCLPPSRLTYAPSEAEKAGKGGFFAALILSLGIAAEVAANDLTDVDTTEPLPTSFIDPDATPASAQQRVEALERAFPALRELLDLAREQSRLGRERFGKSPSGRQEQHRVAGGQDRMYRCSGAPPDHMRTLGTFANVRRNARDICNRSLDTCKGYRDEKRRLQCLVAGRSSLCCIFASLPEQAARENQGFWLVLE